MTSFPRAGAADLATAHASPHDLRARLLVSSVLSGGRLRGLVLAVSASITTLWVVPAMGQQSLNGGTATGNFAYASGTGAIATGEYATATGVVGTAIGDFTTATGHASRATGADATATGNSSLANGSKATATGSASDAIGENATATGATSSANGDFATATGGNGKATWLASSDVCGCHGRNGFC